MGPDISEMLVIIRIFIDKLTEILKIKYPEQLVI